MGNSYSIYRFGHHDLRDNTDYRLFALKLKEHYTTIDNDDYYLPPAFLMAIIN